MGWLEVSLKSWLASTSLPYTPPDKFPPWFESCLLVVILAGGAGKQLAPGIDVSDKVRGGQGGSQQ